MVQQFFSLRAITTTDLVSPSLLGKNRLNLMKPKDLQRREIEYKK